MNGPTTRLIPTCTTVHDIDTSRSYSSEANLLRAMTRYQLLDQCYMVVRNTQGRWTAIFFPRFDQECGIPVWIAELGFKVFG